MTLTNLATETRMENTQTSSQMFNADQQRAIVLEIDCLHEIKSQGRDHEQMFFLNEVKSVKQRVLSVC